MTGCGRERKPTAPTREVLTQSGVGTSHTTA